MDILPEGAWINFSFSVSVFDLSKNTILLKKLFSPQLVEPEVDSNFIK